MGLSLIGSAQRAVLQVRGDDLSADVVALSERPVAAAVSLWPSWGSAGWCRPAPGCGVSGSEEVSVAVLDGISGLVIGCRARRGLVLGGPEPSAATGTPHPYGSQPDGSSGSGP